MLIFNRQRSHSILVISAGLAFIFHKILPFRVNEDQVVTIGKIICTFLTYMSDQNMVLIDPFEDQTTRMSRDRCVSGYSYSYLTFADGCYRAI